MTVNKVKITDKVQYAINRAAELHDGQTRKVSKAPFFTHPFSVALILSDYTKDESIIIAGLLHDVLEDVPGYTYENMTREFGRRVADIVKGVTEERSPRTKKTAKETWLTRKETYLEKLKRDSHEAMMIAAADKIHNLRSMIVEYQKSGERIWKKFNAPEEKKIWFYGEVLGILRERLRSGIVDELHSTYCEAEKLFGIYCDSEKCCRIKTFAKV